MAHQPNTDSIANLKLVDFQGEDHTFAGWRGRQHVILVFNRGFF